MVLDKTISEEWSIQSNQIRVKRKRLDFLTSNDCWDAPAYGVVEPHVAVVDVPQLRKHAVDVEPLHKHPGEGAHVEVMKQDGYHCTHKLEGDRRETRNKEQV